MVKILDDYRSNLPIIIGNQYKHSYNQLYPNGIDKLSKGYLKRDGMKRRTLIKGGIMGLASLFY
jgi:hypothetical protein